EVTYNDLSEDVPEVCRHGEIAAFVSTLRREARPPAVDTAATYAAPDDHHGIRMPVIRTAVSVLGHGASKLGHRQDDGILHPVSEVGDQCGDAASEIAETICELALC